HARQRAVHGVSPKLLEECLSTIHPRPLATRHRLPPHEGFRTTARVGNPGARPAARGARRESLIPRPLARVARRVAVRRCPSDVHLDLDRATASRRATCRSVSPSGPPWLALVDERADALPEVRA